MAAETRRRRKRRRRRGETCHLLTHERKKKKEKISIWRPMVPPLGTVGKNIYQNNLESDFRLIWRHKTNSALGSPKIEGRGDPQIATQSQFFSVFFSDSSPLTPSWLQELSWFTDVSVNYKPVNTRRGFVQNYTRISASVRFLFVYCLCVCWCEIIVQE